MRLPVLVMTPHSSSHLPPQILAEMLGPNFLNETARNHRQRWLFHENDPFTDIIFQLEGAYNLHALVNRFVVDLNRPRDYGGDNGVIKLTDFECRPLYPPSFELNASSREERLRRYWDSFYRDINALIQEDIRLSITGHSMSPSAPKIAPDADTTLRPALSMMTSGDLSGDPINGRHLSLPKDLALAFRDLLAKHFAEIIAKSDVPDEVLMNSPWDVDSLSHYVSDPKQSKRIPALWHRA
ncbi:MAG: N-formylglutamate amidohydrolase [Deinococcales bacterium]